MNPIYTVSIAVHNLCKITRTCIEALIKTVPPEETEIIVHDNASTDETYDYLKSIAGKRPGLPDIGVLRSEVNVGFGEAHNRTLEFAKGIYFLILNNDVSVPPGLLPAMRKRFVKNPQLGLCGMAKTCSELDERGYGVGAERLEYLEASCLMVPTWLARQETLFRTDEFPFAYCEDTDLSLRFRKKGWYIDRIELEGFFHFGAKTSALVSAEKDLDGIHKRNHIVLAQKWGDYLARRKFDSNIILCRNGAMGDVILVEPVVRALKAQNASARVTVVSACGEPAFRDNPDIHEFFRTLNLAPGGGGLHQIFDLNLAYERRPRMHICHAYGEACGVTVTDVRPRLYLRKPDRDWADNTLGARKWAILHPGPSPGWPGRNLDMRKWPEVVIGLREKGYGVAMIGSPVDFPIPCDLNLQGKTTFHQLAAVIERGSLFVGLDSMPMHLAVAFDRPLAALFGMIDPRYRLPDLPYMKAVQASVGCLGCHHILPAPRTDGHCFRGKPICMERIDPASIIRTAVAAVEARMAYLEASKIRLAAIPFCKGKGIDIGCKDDKIVPEAIGLDKDMYPGHVDVIGDARFVSQTFPADNFDYVFSSHCLEDIVDTDATLREWLTILKPGGHLILYVPHPELYKGCNLDHKHPGFTPEDLVARLVRLGCDPVVQGVDSGPERYSTFVVVKKRNPL